MNGSMNGSMDAMPDDGETMQSRIDRETRRRTLDGIYRCLRHILIQIGRDYETCGKASCKRVRRCRGTACDPPPQDGDEA
jgi:hypothetical protein